MDSNILIAILYVLGALTYFHLASALEALTSLAANGEVRMIPWQKSLACVIWPVTVCIQTVILFNDLATGKQE